MLAPKLANAIDYSCTDPRASPGNDRRLALERTHCCPALEVEEPNRSYGNLATIMALRLVARAARGRRSGQKAVRFQ